MHVQTTEYIDVFLNPGDLFFGQGAVRIRTLLGSCVAVTLWNPRTRAGGMCHFMLPGRCKLGLAHTRGRYAEDAIAMLFDEARSHGRVQEYEFKLFGGGNMFPDIQSALSLPIGETNIEDARRLLAARAVSLSAEHSGGLGQRAVMLDLWSGDAWVRHDQPQRSVRGAPSKRSSTC